MVDRPQRPDVVVVGAGAAGIAAGRELLRLGRSVLLVEARDRLGGRAWTVPSGFDAPFDLGCEWLHSADANLLTPMAAEQGFAIDKSEPPWRRPSYQARFDGDGQEAFWAAQSLFEERIEAAAAEAARGGFDCPAASLLEPGGRWNGMLGAISTYYNGAPLERVSVVDYSRYRDTEINWRVVDGYGALIEKLGADLPVRFGCAVTRVDATGRELRVVTSAGTLRTDAVIVTVPTDVLASGAITFSPALDRHMAAAAVLPLGIADKLYLRLEGAEEFEPDTRLGGPSDRVATGAYTLRPGGRPVVEGYFGGDYARYLEKGGLPAFVAAAEEEIGAVLGRDFCRRLTPIRATAWAHDPFSLGSYSHALPGHAEARAVLAAPAEDRIFFAGEAVSPHFFSTAHGAFETGLAAARAVRPRA